MSASLTRGVDTALNKTVPPSACSEIPTYFLNSKHTDPMWKSKSVVLRNTGINEALITHSCLGKILFTRSYPFCRNSDNIGTVVFILTVKRER